MKRRTEHAMERIAQEESTPWPEVRGRAADLAVRTTRRLLTEKLGAGRGAGLIRSAIEDVTRKLA